MQPTRNAAWPYCYDSKGFAYVCDEFENLVRDPHHGRGVSRQFEAVVREWRPELASGDS
jgi:hypothetical protein